MSLIIALLAIAALTAWAYRSIWPRRAKHFSIALPEKQEIYRYGDRTQVVRCEPGWYVDADGFLTRGEVEA
ncbi:MAG: hypothetical protein HGA87_00030 [Desulfobulbaceae bacterium]|nr:hypothetical protein [Desulfobulbaceae bacterium]